MKNLQLDAFSTINMDAQLIITRIHMAQKYSTLHVRCVRCVFGCVWLWLRISSILLYPLALLYWYLGSNDSETTLTDVGKESRRVHIGPLFTMRKDVLPQDLVKSRLHFSNRSDIRQAPGQQRCRDACQISERHGHYNIHSGGSKLPEILW